jgi:preprotein translocase subunit SecG
MNLSTVSCVLALLAATGLSSVSLHSANTFPIPDLDGSPCHPNVGSKQMGKKKSATNLHRTFMIVCVVLACIFSGFNYVTLYRHSTIQQQEREQEERRGSILDMKEIFLIKHHNTSIGSGNRNMLMIVSPALPLISNIRMALQATGPATSSATTGNVLMIVSQSLLLISKIRMALQYAYSSKMTRSDLQNGLLIIGSHSHSNTLSLPSIEQLHQIPSRSWTCGEKRLGWISHYGTILITGMS